MSISQIARSIGESATLKLNEKAAALRAQGAPVIHLGGGEPKSKAPRAAIETGTALLGTGEIRYAACDGTADTKAAVIRYTEEFYGRQAAPENVIVSSGAKQAIMVCLQAILDPRDEVLFPIPYWVSYPDMVRLCGAVPVPVEPEEETLIPRIEDIERRLTDRSRAVIVNSPNNPSGVMYPEEFVRGIVELCEDRGLYLIMDDIYQRLVFDGRRPVSPYRFARDLGEDSKLVVVNGVSKQYAMTGFRIGWAIGNPELIRVMGNIQTHQTSGTSVLLQKAAAAALDGPQDCVEELRRTLESNRNVMLEQLASLPDVPVIRPDATFYCLGDFRRHDPDSTRLSDFLLEKALVVTVPGIEFGLEGRLRLSYCGSVEDIVEGVRRLRWVLDPASPAELTAGDRKLVKDWT